MYVQLLVVVFVVVLCFRLLLAFSLSTVALLLLLTSLLQPLAIIYLCMRLHKHTCTHTHTLYNPPQPTHLTSHIHLYVCVCVSRIRPGQFITYYDRSVSAAVRKNPTTKTRKNYRYNYEAFRRHRRSSSRKSRSEACTCKRYKL